MRTRALALTLLAFTACKKAADKPNVGSGSQAVTGSGSGSGSGSAGSGSGSAAMGSGSDAGSGSAVAGAAAPCYSKEASFTLSAFSADDKSATFCVKEEGDAPKERCSTLAFATGAYSETPVKKPDEPKTAIEYKQSDASVEACTGGKCTKLDLPKLPKKEEGDEYQVKYRINASDDGKWLLATGNELKEAQLIDAATGKVKKKFPIKDQDGGCLEEAWFLGETIYVLGSVCAGPGGTGYLFHPDGKQFAVVGGENGVNPYSAVPLHLDGDSWAFSDLGGGNVEIVDAKSGATKKIEVKRPDECETCLQLDGPQMVAQPLVKAGDKLVSLSGEGISVLDPKTLAVVKTHPFNACK